MKTMLVLAMLAGCYPSTSKSAATTSRELVAFEPGPARALVLAVERHQTAVVVSASWPRTCKGRVVDHVTTTTDTTLKLAGTSDGQTWGYGLLVPMIIAYPVGIADLVIAGGIAVGSGSNTSEDTRVHDGIDTSCNIPAAHVAIQLVLASGGVIDGTTDDRGEVVYLLASAGERFQVRAGDVEQVMPDTEIRFQKR